MIGDTVGKLGVITGNVWQYVGQSHDGALMCVVWYIPPAAVFFCVIGL